MEKVLLIDSDVAFVDAVLALLRPYDCEVECARDMAEAAARLRETGFRCVVVAEELSRMKGHKGVAVVKALCPDARIIVTSRRNTLELESELRRQDIFYYHLKPFGMPELKTAILSALARSDKSGRIPGKAKAPRILVVDDDYDFTDAVARVLRSRSCEVVTARNTSEAMRHLQYKRSDLVVLDVMMETMMEGVALLRRLKHDPELRKVPVLMVSAVDERVVSDLGAGLNDVKYGVAGYLQKPVSSEKLLESVKRALSLGVSDGERN